MRASKRNRIFLGLVTGGLMFAGTGLTFVNNFEKEALIVMLSACLASQFFVCEVSFLWTHLAWYEVKGLARKASLAVNMAALVGAMAWAVYGELTVTLNKLASRGLASNVSTVLKEQNAGAGRRERQANVKAAFGALKDGKLNVDTFPFVLCYLMAGLTVVNHLIVGIGKKDHQGTPRVRGPGDALPGNPALQEAVRQIGFNPGDVKAYVNNRDGGYDLHIGGRYTGKRIKNLP